MRSAEDVFADIETDRSQRERELRLLENIASRTESPEEQSMLYRSLILLTYAHFEGFCKFALLSYVSAVNALRIPCSEACTPLVAATLSKVFAALRDLNNKHEHFARELPDDRALHMLARQRMFVENYGEITTAPVELKDQIVDTGSNLNSVALKRNLYQLGLSYPAVEKHRSSIDRLLGIRNAIAHGDALKAPTESETAEYTYAAFAVMKFVQHEVYESLRSEVYRRAATGA